MATNYIELVRPAPYRLPFVSPEITGTWKPGTDTIECHADAYQGEYDDIWEVIRTNFIVTTDATVVNRVPQVRFYDREGRTQLFIEFNAMPASQTGHNLVIGTYAFSDDGGGVAINDPNQLITLQKGSLYLMGRLSYIKFTLANGVAGDSIWARVLLRYRNYDWGIWPPSSGSVTPPVIPPPVIFPPARFD